MSDIKLQETLNQIDLITPNSIKQLEIGSTPFNGTSAVDLNLSTLPSPTLPAITTVQLSALTPTYTLSGGTSTNLTWNTPNVWATTGAVGAQGSTIGATITGGKDGQISLKGKDADIVVNGKSMSDWMARVEERLNILTPNPELEKDWDDLRKLGERYRKLEKKCKEKAETWKKLKAMPPPTAD